MTGEPRGREGREQETVTYAIFKAGGFQYRAEPGDVLRVPRMQVEVGDVVTFDEVLLGAADGEVLVGRPTVEDAAVRAEVLAHDRADKIIVFKFKRRKQYRRKRGHRQDYTEIRVAEIDLGGGRVASAGAEPAAEAKPKKKSKKKAGKPAKKPAAKAGAKKGEAKAGTDKESGADRKAKTGKKTKAKKPRAEKKSKTEAGKKTAKSKKTGSKKTGSKKKSKKKSS